MMEITPLGSQTARTSSAAEDVFGGCLLAVAIQSRVLAAAASGFAGTDAFTSSAATATCWDRHDAGSRGFAMREIVFRRVVNGSK